MHAGDPGIFPGAWKKLFRKQYMNGRIGLDKEKVREQLFIQWQQGQKLYLLIVFIYPFHSSNGSFRFNAIIGTVFC
jgi:hypothetical protein